MSSLPAILRNSAVLLTGTLLSKLLVLASYAVLTRTLGPAGFGQYSLLFAWIAFFEIITDSGLDALVQRESAQEPGETGRYVAEALVLRTLLAVGAVGAAVLLFRPLTGSELGAPLVALAAATLVTSSRRTSWRSLLETPFRIELDMRLPMILAVTAEVIHLALLVGPVREYGVTGAIAAQALAPLPLLAWILLAAHAKAPLRGRPSAARLATLARGTLPFALGLLANVILARVDVLMLERLRDSTEVGWYAAPTRIVEVANLLPAMLMASVFPLFARLREDVGAVARMFQESLRALVAGLIPLVGIQIVFAGPLLVTLFGDGWRPSADVLPWLALAEILIYADIVTTARLTATGRERLNLLLLAIAAAANVALNWYWIPAYGARGAAGATLVAYAVRVGVPWLLPPTRSLARETWSALTPAILAGLLAFGPAVLWDSWRIALFALGVVLYPPLLWLFGGLKVADFVTLRAVLRKRPATGVGEDRRSA